MPIFICFRLVVFNIVVSICFLMSPPPLNTGNTTLASPGLPFGHSIGTPSHSTATTEVFAGVLGANQSNHTETAIGNVLGGRADAEVQKSLLEMIMGRHAVDADVSWLVGRLAGGGRLLRLGLLPWTYRRGGSEEPA